MSGYDQGSTARRLLELAHTLGCEVLFTNLGSDHPAFIEAFAALGESGQVPRIVVCPHEMTALSAAHGHAMISRRPQIVLVHVDVGTQNLGGSVHDAARGRIPAIIVAGLSPVTTEGTRTGRRNEFIHFIQDTPRQHEIVAQYMKWCYEVRAPETIDAALLRAHQIACSAPEGPVYLTGAREVWDASVPPAPERSSLWPPARLAGLTPDALEALHQSLAAARRPIVITAYLGRNPAAVPLLVEMSERYGVGVCEVSPQYLNFPGSHPHHLSYRRNSAIEEADLILMVDVDVPWIPSRCMPAADCRLVHVDADPIKTGLAMWHFPAHAVHQADSGEVLRQLVALPAPDAAGRAERCTWIASMRSRLQVPSPAPGDAIASEELTACVRELIGERTVVIFEEPSSTESIPPVLALDRPGSWFSSGGSGLGWGTNAAIGAKLARPEAEVIALVGDGCYVFGVPSSTYWVAEHYGTPFLTVIYNNGGWHSPKLSTTWVHPHGTAVRDDRFYATSSRGSRLADIAAATGSTAAFSVHTRERLRETLQEAMRVVRGGRSAVVDVHIAPMSSQQLA